MRHMQDDKFSISEDKSKSILLNETVLKLGFISFFADVASEMLYPITPLFLTSVVGASMTSIGFLEGCAEAVASLLKVYSGSWSDRWQARKPFVWSGYLLAAIAKPLIGISTSWLGVFGARSLDRAGKGIRGGPRDALLSESISATQRGAAFGWHRAMDTAGAAIGPLLAIWFLKVHQGPLNEIYFWSIIPGFLAVSLALTLKEKRTPQTNDCIKNKKTWDLNSLSKSYKKYLFCWGLFSITNSSDVFLLLKAENLTNSMTDVIYMYCFYNLFYAVLSPYLGKLSDRFGRKIVLAFGLGIFAIVYFGFAMAETTAQLWWLFAIYGFYMAATDGVGKSFAIDLVSPSLKATGVAVLGAVTGLSTIVASSMAGILWDHFGPSAAFIFGSAGSILALLVLLSLKVPKIQQ